MLCYQHYMMCDRAFLLPTDNAMKYLSLVTLTVQNAALGLCTRYVRTRPGDMFLSTSGKWRTRQLAKRVLTPGPLTLTGRTGIFAGKN